MQLQGIDTFTRYTGFGFGWSNFWLTNEDDYYAESMTATRQIHLQTGGKIKMQVRVLIGNDVETAPDSCRLLIRKA